MADPMPAATVLVSAPGATAEGGGMIETEVLAELFRGLRCYMKALDYDFNAMDNWVWLDNQWKAGKMIGAKRDHWRW